MAKDPVAGHAKTRLARDVGVAAAGHIASALLEDTWKWVHNSPRFQPVLVLDRPPGIQGDRPLLVPSPTTWPQGTGDLGCKIGESLRRATLANPSGALVVGSDAVGVPVDVLESAADHLDHGRAVIGPTEDGGFYLLGLPRTPEPGLFAGIPWSTEGTERATRNRLTEAGYEVESLPTWFDVDTVHDLVRLVELTRTRPERVPATRRLLEDETLRKVWPASEQNA